MAGGTRTAGGALSQSVTYQSAATAPVFTPPVGKTFTGWSTDFSSVTGPLTVTAIYGDITFQVTPTAGAGGIISPAVPQTIIYGQSTSFTLTPSAGHSIASVTGTCGGNLVGNTFTTWPVSFDCSVQANFSISSYPVTFDLDGGTRTGGGVLNQTVSYGGGASAPVFTAPPGKSFAGWSADFSSVTGPLVVTALYGTSIHSVVPSAGAGGNISPSTPQNVVHGGAVSFTLLPATGYQVASVEGSCSGALSGNTYTANAINADCSVAATFEPAIFAVTFDLAGGSWGGGGALTQQVVYGADATAPLVTPPKGKVFQRWSTDFTHVSGALTVVALYQDTTLTVTATTGSGGTVTPSGAQTVAYNKSASFQLVPAPGYAFAGATGDCVGGKVGDIYTTAPVIADCQLAFAFDSILKVVDETGKIYIGDDLKAGASSTFKVTGGSGKRRITASTTQAGVTNLPTTESIPDFLGRLGASLTDLGNGSYRFSASRSGRYTLEFIDEDGQSSSLTFSVHPTIGFTSTYQESSNGKVTQVMVLLDDDPIDYPAIVAFTVDGSALASNLSSQGAFNIVKGRLATLDFVPNTSVGEIGFTLTTSGLVNAQLGDIRQHKVILKDIAKLPLSLEIKAQQGNESKQLMLNTGGTVTLLTSLTGPAYSYDWSASAPELGIANATNWQPSFNPQSLNGTYLAKVTVKELAAPNRSQTVELLLHIAANEPPAYANFFNLEYEASPNRLPICTDGGMARVYACHDVLKAVYMETLSTYEIKLGRSSDYASWRDLQFGLATEARDIHDLDGKPVANTIDPEYSHLGYEVDFEVSGLEQSGQTVPVVIPLKPGLTIPANAVWRKYSSAGWHNFVENDTNKLYSAKRQINGLCPSPSATEWSAGLKAGDDCVRLVIQDGGPNDFDARADGVIRDPSVLAVKPEVIDVTTVGKGRGGSIDWLLLVLIAFGSLGLATTKSVKGKRK